QERVYRGAEGEARRCGPGIVAVGPGLDQLQVVIAEVPEKGLGALQSTGVVESLEGGGGLLHEFGQGVKHRAVEGVGDLGVGRGVTYPEREFGGVEDLYGEPTPDFHLTLVEGGV